MRNHLSETDSILITRSPRTLFFTGATGLLGSYMVRDLLLKGRRLAVLVRRDRKRPAAERVDGMLRGWEAELGRPLPRPTVLEGDLSRPLCGLDARAIEWIDIRHTVSKSVKRSYGSLRWCGTTRSSPEPHPKSSV